MNPQTVEYVQKLISLGAHLKGSWTNFINSQRFQTFNDLLIEFLFTDIEQTSRPNQFLKENIQNPQCCVIRPIIVQIDEIIDVSVSDVDRLHSRKSQNPTLKLLINNGGHKIAGVVQNHIEKLDLDTEPGIKVLIKPGASLVYGVLIFTEDSVVILGGNSPSLVEKQKDMIESGQLMGSAFQRIDKEINSLPEFQFGLTSKFVFQDIPGKNFSKNKNDILQAPFQINKQPEPKQELNIPKTKPPLHEIHQFPEITSKQSTIPTNNNMPAFKPTKQIKNSDMNASSKSNQISISLPASKQSSSSLSMPNNTSNSTSNSTSTPNQPSNLELWQLYNFPRQKNESLISVKAHVKRLHVNNDPSLTDEKKKLRPFIVTLESDHSHQKLDISIDPLFLELLFNLDYIFNLPPEDLIGTAHVCEKKIKEILKSPLSIIDKGSGKPHDRYLLTK